MIDSIVTWAGPLKWQDVAVLAFLAVVVTLSILIGFTGRVRHRLHRPAQPLVVGLAFVLLVVLTLIALKWG